MQIKKINQLKNEIENLLKDNKAMEIKSINLKNKTSIADFMVIASGNSSKHIQALSEMLLEKNIYVIPFSFPVVPENQARIRVQLSSSHTKDQLNHSISAFKECGKALNII